MKDVLFSTGATHFTQCFIGLKEKVTLPEYFITLTIEIQHLPFTFFFPGSEMKALIFMLQ